MSGIITPTAGSAVDGTVLNPDAPNVPNNTFEQAQALFNPLILGGFARADDPVSSSDFYAISLAEGQQARLEISNFDANAPTAVDLDLHLFDSAHNHVVSSNAHDSAVERVTAPQDGEYILEVRAEAGQSLYLLTVGQNVTSSHQTTDQPTTALQSGPIIRTGNQDFIPGDVIVRFRDAPGGADPRQRALHLANKGQTVGMRPLGGGPGRAMLMHFDQATERDTVFGTLGIPGDTGHLLRPGSMPEQTRHRLDTLRVIKALRQRDDVLYAEPNYIRHTLLQPNDSFLPFQWHYPLINMPQAWDLTTGSEDVIVAVVDSGVFLDHPDLQDSLTRTAGGTVIGFDFIREPDIAMHNNGINPNPDDPGDGITPGTSSFHGTHVAGTVAATTDNSVGVAGVGWDTRIMPIRVTGRGGVGSSFDVMQGVRYAAGLPNESGTVPPQTAHIINLSLGGTGSSIDEQLVFEQIRELGIIVIAAAGNGGNTTPIFPASYEGVVSVGAVDPARNKAPYSSFGATLDLMAPGGDMRFDTTGDGYPDGVLSTHADDSGGSRVAQYAFLQGTSMAAPHVAGVAALMKAAFPGLTADQFQQLLRNGDLTEPRPAGATAGERNNSFGYGLIDAFKAVQAAGQEQPGPSLNTSPGALDFGSFIRDAAPGTDERTFTLSAMGSETEEISTVAPSATWINVAEQETDDAGFGSYAVGVDITGRLPGNYNGEIVITAVSGLTARVGVSMQILDPGAGNTEDAGVHYVLLVDAGSFQTVAQVVVEAEDGHYRYAFNDVEPGGYFVIAGTDNNNDFFICGAGEACGSFITLNRPTLIQVGQQDQDALDFTTGFRANPELSSLANASPSGFQRLRKNDKRQIAP